eukprot:GHVR01178776.1.p1 GENE.GHVR01178776.1~~GHVR01178776.1.p1  ORF type:complete len:148 (-),score=82.24 GHVR01178776.1:643-1053(-)
MHTHTHTHTHKMTLLKNFWLLMVKRAEQSKGLHTYTHTHTHTHTSNQVLTDKETAAKGLIDAVVGRVDTCVNNMLVIPPLPQHTHTQTHTHTSINNLREYLFWRVSKLTSCVCHCWRGSMDENILKNICFGVIINK